MAGRQCVEVVELQVVCDVVEQQVGANLSIAELVQVVEGRGRQQQWLGIWCRRWEWRIESPKELGRSLLSRASGM